LPDNKVATDTSEFSESDIQQLMDMGFARNQAIRALKETVVFFGSSLEFKY
jgi:uncharacterized UBP type Zn finger protein